jgi:hypothetical protein
MKKNILYFTALLLLFAACKPNCEPKIPKGVKPIDWENYNDVYTVKWNYTGDCSTTGKTGLTIKMYGWIFHPQTAYPSLFCMLSDSLFIEANNPKCAMVHVRCIEDIEHLKAKFDTSDLTKKCYVTGELFIADRPTNDCCTTEPEIMIMDANDVYFE